jgi:replication-associated recombination protein RarA
LQKAIRRGDVAHTQLAVSSLMTSDPARFWRRLVIIAFEDIGLADLSIVGQVTCRASTTLSAGDRRYDRVVRGWRR